MKIKLLTLLAIAGLAVACNKNADMKTLSQADNNTPLSAEDELALHNDTIPKVCLDKVEGPDSGMVQTQGVLVDDLQWRNGKTLKIFFINGGDYLQAKVIQYARVWADHANLHFVETKDKDESDIRVGFKLGGDETSWSWIGTEAKNHKGQTMNFGWFDTKTSEAELSRTITHEFGHAIGLGHEQSSPDAHIQWDKPKVYRYYKNSQNWTKEMVDNNIFYKYPKSAVTNSEWDKESIMQYPVPQRFTLNNLEIGYNYYLSARDKSFIKRMYPAAN